MVLAVHVGQRWILNDAQHQVRHDPRILHNICPRPVVALRIGGNVADIELDGRGASVELIVQPGLDQAIKELPQSKWAQFNLTGQGAFGGRVASPGYLHGSG